MRKTLLAIFAGICCLYATAEVTTTVFDFTIGPASEITLPENISWPESGSKTIPSDATFSKGDIVLRISYSDAATYPRLYKIAYEDSWGIRMYDNTKISFKSTDEHNLTSIRIYVDSEKTDLTTMPQMAGTYEVTYNVDGGYLEWADTTPGDFIYMDMKGTIYINIIKVVTDHKASLTETVCNDSTDDKSVTYYDLQGHKAENPSGGLFIRVTSAGSEKVFIP